MIDGVSPECAAARSFEAVHGPAVAAGGRRALAAAHLLAWAGTHQPWSGRLGHSQVLDRGEGGVAEAREGLAHSAGELGRAAALAASNSAQRSTSGPWRDRCPGLRLPSEA